jgi:hypothetical protein
MSSEDFENWLNQLEPRIQWNYEKEVHDAVVKGMIRRARAYCSTPELLQQEFILQE